MRIPLARLLAKSFPKVGQPLGPSGPSRVETLQAIEEHTQKYKGPRASWAVKAAVWSKKVHVSRGHVEVGRYDRIRRRFVIDQAAIPQFVVPDLKDTQLRPYVAHYDQEKLRSLKAGEPPKSQTFEKDLDATKL